MKHLIIIMLILSACSPCKRIAKKMKRLDRRAYIEGCIRKTDTIRDTFYLPEIVYKDSTTIDLRFLTDTLYLPNNVITYIVERLDTDTSKFDTLGIHCTAFVNNGTLRHYFNIDSTAIPVKVETKIVPNYEVQEGYWKQISIILGSFVLALLFVVYKIKV